MIIIYLVGNSIFSIFNKKIVFLYLGKIYMDGVDMKKSFDV